MNRFLKFGLLSLIPLWAQAETLEVDSFNFYGQFPVLRPLMVDSLDINGKDFSSDLLSRNQNSIVLPESFSYLNGTALPPADSPAVGILAFNFENKIFAKPEIKVTGLKNHAIYVDGRKIDSDRLTLRPATHNIAIKYVATPDSPADSVKVTLSSDNDAKFSLRTDGKRRYGLMDVLHGDRITSASVSPDGKYSITAYTTGKRGGSTSRTYRLTNLADGKTILSTSDYIAWMPKGSRYYRQQSGIEGTDLVAVDATTGAEEILCRNMPDDASPVFTPDEKKIILIRTQEGHKEDPGIYEVIEPEDRQPGWRNRTFLSILDPQTGIETPLTFGNRNVYLQDISPDSKTLLISTHRSRLEKRPTSVATLLTLDLTTMKADTLVAEDGFLNRAIFSPDGTKVLASGSPEALRGIGLNLPEGRIPNMTETELFIIDRTSKEISPITRNFNPSVADFAWSRADGMIYLNAEDRDMVNLFRINPTTGDISRIGIAEDNIGGFSIPDSGKEILVFGESASKPQSLYALNTKTLKPRLLDTPKAAQLADVKLGTCEAWDFVNSHGDSICGRFYLPPDFDPTKKYPLIVNYYGGCSPTSRNFESRYPHNAYASQGYVVYVIQPSGATGFGQEFASRHVNTAGEGVAQDIIEGTKRFCEEHPYVDASKIGCIGASYGGFMTQYLQTVTDIFAAAISHAGISDHTSYWGEGYWGYSYSEVSMAKSYPWADRDLYVKQSPLYNADKIHTPLLFLHGDSDNNVPVGESIQMFTALKLLGRPTAFVAVADQDHHILDYDKRIKWQDTIFAWFAKYLKDEPGWWNEMYPDSPLKQK